VPTVSSGLRAWNNSTATSDRPSTGTVTALTHRAGSSEAAGLDAGGAQRVRHPALVSHVRGDSQPLELHASNGTPVGGALPVSDDLHQRLPQPARKLRIHIRHPALPHGPARQLVRHTKPDLGPLVIIPSPP
jgi:hypothetical protein